MAVLHFEVWIQNLIIWCRILFSVWMHHSFQHLFSDIQEDQRGPPEPDPWSFGNRSKMHPTKTSVLLEFFGVNVECRTWNENLDLNVYFVFPHLKSHPMTSKIGPKNAITGDTVECFHIKNRYVNSLWVTTHPSQLRCRCDFLMSTCWMLITCAWCR